MINREWIPTNRLRLIERRIFSDFAGKDVLQQKWTREAQEVVEEGERSFIRVFTEEEWRDVPHAGVEMYED